MICVIHKMDLGVGEIRNSIYIIGLTSSPRDKKSGERSRSQGTSCLKAFSATILLK